jgi:hypothetical protein
MTVRGLSDAEQRAWIRLARAPNVGPATFSTLIDTDRRLRRSPIYRA